MTWDDVDIDKNDYRSIDPRSRSHGVGTYNQDSMFNLAAFRESSRRVGSAGYTWANSGTADSGARTTQISSLETRPSFFWNGQRVDYNFASSAGAFVSQNNGSYYSIWRLTDDSDIMFDFSSGDNGTLLLLNHNSDWDDQLFAVNGQGKGNTTNGSPLSKVVLLANYTDFSTSRPLLMSLASGLPRNGADAVSKSEPVDAYHRASDYDYYLNYYSKYDETSKRLLAKDDGMDWYRLYIRTRIDGTQPLATIAATAAGVANGYSKVALTQGVYFLFSIKSLDSVLNH